MPLYEYQCEVCGHRVEVIQKFSDAPLEQCPKCGRAVRKLQAAPAFQLKGTGWYVTDYAKKDQPAEQGSGGSSEGAAGDKDAAPSDKSEKTEKADKTNKADTAEKTVKTEKTEKTEKNTSAKDSSSSSSSSTTGSKTPKSEG